MSAMTRRHFGRLALTSAPALGVASAWIDADLHAQVGDPVVRSDNRSFIGGVQFGLQPFCYHDLPMTPENRSSSSGVSCRTASAWSSCTPAGSSRVSPTLKSPRSRGASSFGNGDVSVRR